MMNERILREINSINGVVGTVKFGGATLYRAEKRVSVVFNSSFAQPKDLPERIEKLLLGYIPGGYDISVDVKKIVTEAEFVVKEVASYLRSAHGIACATVTEKEITVIKEDKVRVNVLCEKTVFDFCSNGSVGAEIEKLLSEKFADAFTVEFTDKGFSPANEAVLTERKAFAPVKSERRTLRVTDVSKYFDDDKTDVATYIADTKDMLGEVYLAGVITNVRELITKTDKPYFIIDFTDRTGMISGTIFPNKDKIPKLRKLDKGVSIILRGEFSMRGEFRNLRIYSINLCIFPENFVPVEREKRKVANNYSFVSPKPVELEEQDNFLIDKSAPECFKGRTFVVFDLETTGTDFDDKITEIGAVKIVDGKFTERFTTLINPGKHIPKDVTEITGIDDDMVKDALSYEKVRADFYKFCYGATLIGHNVEFDIRFVRNQSKPLDYIFDNPLMDTLAIAREVVYGVANYKLNTLCEKFGIKFRHHRAYSDAFATAELFIELIRIRKSLPF